MQTLTEPIIELNVRDLLEARINYEIPIYQRNYAWQAKEIEQLIQDVIDYREHHQDKNYYIGTLVVSQKDSEVLTFETIDGQQRLTTLTILAAAIKNKIAGPNNGYLSWFEKANITFASREKSTRSIEAAFNGEFSGDDYERNIQAAYNICLTELSKKLKEHQIDIGDFCIYLFSQVKILRVALPQEIDLNHYFEVMNSRGEQLEKHEILKAKLMNSFNVLLPEERILHEKCFHLVWDACADMERYLQTGFIPEQRHLLFGPNDWDTLAINSFDELVVQLMPTLKMSSEDDKSIDQIISSAIPGASQDVGELRPERFNSVINFPNFLLHVLRVQMAADIVLDDKRLITVFEDKMKDSSQGELAFTKEFIFNLLKCKFLFDKYVIKREFAGNTDRWSLKRFKYYKSASVTNSSTYLNTFGAEQDDPFGSDNRNVLMLLSMFHVSIPSQSYKYWLNAALNYLFNQEQVEAKNYISYLEHIAKRFVFDRYLSRDPADYFPMVFKGLGPVERTLSDLDLGKLNFHTLENNLIFNFLDYLLWARYKNGSEDKRIKEFEYTFRSSVEHYYPQTPMEGFGKLDEVVLHSFGNLCLISHEKNSRLNNFTPDLKRGFYQGAESLDSIKQFLMMQGDEWSRERIIEHGKEMISVFESALQSNFVPLKESSQGTKWFQHYRRHNPQLLIRALLGFDDYPQQINDVKYCFSDFDYIQGTEAYKLFESYVSQNAPIDLEAVIDYHLQNENLKTDYRYLFIKYPETIAYCENGNFTWEEQENFITIFLLKRQKRTEGMAVELNTFLQKIILAKECGLYAEHYYDCLNIHVSLEDGVYVNSQKDEEHALTLKLWCHDGQHVAHRLVSNVHGNDRAVKQLTEYDWHKKSDGGWEMKGKDVLLKLGNDFDGNTKEFTKTILRLLKNGFGIKKHSK